MPIQEAVIPYLLQPVNDGEPEPKASLIALAQTGTGKTAAYGIPVLQGVDAS